MSVDQNLYDRLVAMADALAEKGYKQNKELKRGLDHRKGAKAEKARQNLEALQYALTFLRDEKRRDGYHNITPADTPFARYIARQYA